MLTHLKVAVVGIFMVGGVAILASILRVYFLHVYFSSPEPVFATIEVSPLICLQHIIRTIVLTSALSRRSFSGPKSNSTQP